MSTLVKFVAEQNKKGLQKSDYETYLNDIGVELCNRGLAGSSTAPVCNSMIDDLDVFNFEIYNVAGYRLMIIFEFETFENELQLSVEISEGIYELSVKNEYLEKVKLCIKDAIRSDWENIIWLFDKDAELLSMSLYPEVYEAENLLRQMINEVMIKKYGASWWEIFVPEAIKSKSNQYKKDYKSKVPGFKNVDEHLMSIDLRDLLTIISLKHNKWIPAYDGEINDILTGHSNKSCERVIQILNSQLTIERDLWDDFKEYLPTDFRDKVSEFSKNRNHVAHNKLLDRQAYRQILNSAKEIQDSVSKALVKINEVNLSQEELSKKAVEKAEYEDMLRDIRAEEAGVEINNSTEIQSIFDERIYESYQTIEDRFRFRMDLEFKYQFDAEETSGIFFTVLSKVTEEEMTFKYEMIINSGEGEESDITISSEGFQFQISYINGEALYNEEQANYLPESDGVFDIHKLNQLTENVIDKIDQDMESLYAKASSQEISRIKDGGSPIMLPDIPCSECGEYAICIDEDFATYGKCLNCGTDHDIHTCDRCGAYFDNDLDGHVEENGVAFCNNCYQEMQN